MVTFIKELKRIPRGDVPDFVAAAMPPVLRSNRLSERCGPFRASQHGALLDPEKECPRLKNMKLLN